MDESIGILKTIEGVPKDVKVYCNSEGKIAPSAGPIVNLIERLKPNEETLVGRMLKMVTHGSQALSRR